VRILYFADIRFPLERANGIQTMQTCHGLAERHHVVHLVVRRDSHKPARDPFAFYDLPLDDRLVIEPVGVAGRPAFRRAQYLARAAGRALGAREDVILTRDLGVASLLLGVPARLRPPVVYESHGFAPVVGEAMPELVSGGRRATSRKQRRLQRRERKVWRGADGYVTITRSLADELKARLGDRDHLAVIPDGVRLEPRRTFTPPGRHGDPIVAYAGHLYPWKGVSVLLRALSLLPNARGLIIGGHPGETDLETTRRDAASLGLAERVRFTGAVPPSEVAALLAGADVLVLPNTSTRLSAQYTSPLKLFEYLAAGKPIVASDLPSIREVLEDGRNAVLAAPDDAAALASAITRVVADPALAERIARQAFGEAAEYTWARRAERLELLMTRLPRVAARAS
jgi:glycosyltransferase involved in cell wall biosynthesis